jgi:hypothetical protein
MNGNMTELSKLIQAVAFLICIPEILSSNTGSKSDILADSLGGF